MRFSIKLKLAVAFGVLLLLSGAAGMIGIVKLAAVDSNIKGLLTGPVELETRSRNWRRPFIIPSGTRRT